MKKAVLNYEMQLFETHFIDDLSTTLEIIQCPFFAQLLTISQLE